VTIAPKDIGVVVCGVKVGQYVKVCYERCQEGNTGCRLKSNEVVNTKIGLTHECIFVLGKFGDLGGRVHVFSTPTVSLTLVTPSVLEILLPQKLSYNEWVPIFQFLNEKILSLQDFDNLGMRALDIKKATTPSVAGNRSRFDDIINSLLDVGLLDSDMDTVDPVF